MPDGNTPTVRERIAVMLDPAELLYMAASHYLTVCFEAVFHRGEPLAPLLRSAKIRDEAFGRFWLKFSALADQTPSTTDPDAPPPPPESSAALIPPLIATASGSVLDIGPGSGTQIPLLKDLPAIRTIYGAEPCIGLHDELRARISAAGLDAKYRILSCSVEKTALVPALQKAGVAVSDEGVFDTILCIRVLCSVPDPDRTIADLYDLLRPGGKLLITEHVVNPWLSPKGSVLGRLAQAVYGWLGWSFFVGDCHLNRDTTRSLRKAAERDGGWEVVELEEHFGWTPLPYVSGRLVKRG